MRRGRLITLEGIEGAGKSTAAGVVRDWLAARGIAVRATREPGGTPLAERMRELVLTPDGERMPAVAETLLMFAARAVHVANLIRPALERGEWVVCDRFTDATRAYQGGGRGLDPALIDTLAAATHADVQPDCTLLFDLPVATGMLRARQRSGPTDRFEREQEVFFERVRNAYLALARAEPARIRLIDASQPLERVREQVEAALAMQFDRLS